MSSRRCFPALSLLTLLLAGPVQQAAAQVVMAPAPRPGIMSAPDPWATIIRAETRPSPMAVAATKLSDGTYVKVVYSSPRRQDPQSGQARVIYGRLVPYGEVWRLGANEATEITTTGDIRIGGQTLPAGTYSLFAIPREESWTIIVNRELGQWGAYEYTPSSDVFRFDVPVSPTSEIYDAFTMSFDEGRSNLNIVWENTRVQIPIEAL